MKVFFKSLLAIALTLLATGCTSHPRRVNCEAHLKAINAPGRDARE